MNLTTKLSVLFVCHGNICRSPMAEFFFRRQVSRAGLMDFIDVSSAGISNEEAGNPVYPLAKRILATHGIGCRDKVACQMTRKMYDESDYVVVMDSSNLAGVRKLVPQGDKTKLSRLLDFVKSDDPAFNRDIADPWYTRDFEKAWEDITLGCNSLLEYLQEAESSRLTVAHTV